ncbi:MAG: RNA-directed DNA polymerase [bacterium]|nr:RNA-directed DNA polymerase [bacterium]
MNPLGGGLIRRKIYHNIFEEIISLENLFLAWREFCRGKKNKSDAQEFEFDLEDNLFELHGELKHKTYQHFHYTAFSICDPKPRRIHKACVRDRVLHHDEDALWLIEKVIKSFEKTSSKGLPLGNVTSQLFANIYLNELDRFIKHILRARYYLRYCDDFVILGESEECLEDLVPLISDFLAESLKLQIHSDKIMIRKYSQGIDFLGYVVLPHYRVLRTKTKRRIFKKITIKYQELRQCLITEKSFNQSLQSYFGVLKHCDGYKARKKIYDIFIKY